MCVTIKSDLKNMVPNHDILSYDYSLRWQNNAACIGVQYEK